MSKRILITGAAGYIGHQLGNRLARDFYVIGTDIRGRDDLDFPLQVMDIRDAGLTELLKREQITHVVHLASILQASKDRERDFDIDVNGTHNVLKACVEAGVQQLTVTSSGAAYGYYADNPAWIDEQDANRIHYTLEASLWMIYWEVMVHLYTIQRLKQAQGLPTKVTIPLMGYLSLPEYTGEAAQPAPPQIRVG